MWIYDKTHLEDLNHIIKDKNIPWSDLDGKTIFVTGATGLIGQNIVNALLYYGLWVENPPKVIALVRNIEKAELLFAEQLKDCGNCLKFFVSDITASFELEEKIDYIIHGASQTASSAFIEKPVETIDIAISGTKNMLEFAKRHKVESFVYLSSMEVYGYPEKGEKVIESKIGALSPLIVRNSYPLSKQICESLCCAYVSEYAVPTKIARLTQTFGPGVDYNDKRVFAEFARCVIEKRDIVLKTKGETERSYLYTMDAVSAILTVMLKGENGQAYSVANEDTYCSIAEMANMVANLGDINVKFDLQDVTAQGYANTLYMDLDTSLLKSLGWKSTVNLEKMFKHLIESIKRSL